MSKETPTSLAVAETITDICQHYRISFCSKKKYLIRDLLYSVRCSI